METEYETGGDLISKPVLSRVKHTLHIALRYHLAHCAEPRDGQLSSL